MDCVKEHAPRFGVEPLCQALDLPRSTVYRRLRPAAPRTPRPKSPLALSDAERHAVLETLHDERFVDQPPAAVAATLLDEGRYLCSARTMYRILEAEAEVRERRNQLTHPPYAKPELLATRPNEVWSWDITKLKGPAKWTYYYLYVILDIFSRYVTGWMVAERESASLAKRLIEETCAKQRIAPQQLTLHADRGSSMRSKPVALTLSDLGVTKTHSRPYTSNDNPYSESQFKTLKYRPEFPARFGTLQQARAFCQDFFDWYNTRHRHSGIAWLTPEDLHHGRADQIIQVRQQALDDAFARNPQRFKGKPPKAARPPKEVWINPPEEKKHSQNESENTQAVLTN